jgi:hypothetical protein
MDSQQQSDSSPEDCEASQPGQEQERRPESEGHAGQGADSAMKQMRVWEQRRASQSAGKGRQGPN